MKLVRIPAGKFMRGSPTEEFARSANEGPAHEVQITRAFYIGAYEVTQEEYQKVMGTNPSYCRTGGPGEHRVRGLMTARHPVENVSWEEAAAFCVKLSALPTEKGARRTYRLPTEAEWEYACRAGTTTAFHFGNSLSSREANFDGTRPPRGAADGPHLDRTAAVGSYKPNAWGLYDMHGNVAEWCSDWLADYPGGPLKDPRGPDKGKTKVVRSGAWGDPGSLCRTARRTGFGVHQRLAAIGFRVVCVTGR
jgi:formylglycine-generating enzyme required for sulfatase activity